MGYVLPSSAREDSQQSDPCMHPKISSQLHVGSLASSKYSFDIVEIFEIYNNPMVYFDDRSDSHPSHETSQRAQISAPQQRPSITKDIPSESASTLSSTRSVRSRTHKYTIPKRRRIALRLYIGIHLSLIRGIILERSRIHGAAVLDVGIPRLLYHVSVKVSAKRKNE